MIAIDIKAFIVFCITLMGENIETIEGKSQFILNKVTDNAFYYQVSTNNEVVPLLRTGLGTN